MKFERTIKEAYDKISGFILKADVIFDDTKDAFVVRKQFHKNKIELYCVSCHQKLNVSTSKYDRLHFKHNPNANFCLLKDGKLSPDETEKIYAIYRSKESERHKYLKNQIGIKLSQLNDISNVQIDDKFIFDKSGKRKPDVYCKYLDIEIVFEIQLSDLSLRYIINRHEFYQNKGIFLIWILDNFDIHGQKQTERDIKYLTEYQNFFKFDENAEQFRLICEYKFPYITDNNKLLTKWELKSIALSQLKFDTLNKQAYFYDFGRKKIEKERLQIKTQEELKEKAKRRQLEYKKRIAEVKSKSIIDDLRDYWKRKEVYFIRIQREIEDLEEDEISIFNKSKAFLSENGQPKIHHWFKIAKNEHFHFLDFVLDCNQIKIDCNELSIDGKTIIQSLFENHHIEYKGRLLRKILKKGYIFQEIDIEYVNELSLKPKEIAATKILCELSRSIIDKSLIDDLFDHSTLICTIESAKRNEIVGSGFKANQWIAFANNAIHSYSQYWEYIEIAFKQYGIWDKLIELDKKGTFQNKLYEFYQKEPSQSFDCDELFVFLYPELLI